METFGKDKHCNVVYLSILKALFNDPAFSRNLRTFLFSEHFPPELQTRISVYRTLEVPKFLNSFFIQCKHHDFVDCVNTDFLEILVRKEKVYYNMKRTNKTLLLGQMRPLMSVSCGGGHRSWHLAVDQSDQHAAFFFIKDKNVFVNRRPVESLLDTSVKVLNWTSMNCVSLLVPLSLTCTKSEQIYRVASRFTDRWPLEDDMRGQNDSPL